MHISWGWLLVGVALGLLLARVGAVRKVTG